MNSGLKKLKEKRFKDINTRLSKIRREDVRTFLLKYGYFPESQFLPSDFFSTTSLVEKAALKKLKKLSYDKAKEGKPTFLFFPRSKYAIRALGVPPIEGFVHLSNFISDFWDEIKKHLQLNQGDLIIPYSYPLFFENKKRSDVSISNHKVLSELDIPVAVSHFNYCIFLDIKSFYPSTYTHTLAWCLDSRTRERPERNNKHNFANKFDSLTRKLYNGRTKGILIGPYTSDLASEILLRTIDKEISEKISNKKIETIGFRFKDDYVLFFNRLEDADFTRKCIQQILNDYHLEVNDNKTRVVHTDEFEDKKVWKVEVEKLKNEINEVYQSVNKDGLLVVPEKRIRFWLKKTQSLYELHDDEYIIKTILGNLVKEKVKSISIKKTTTSSCPHQIALEEVYISIFSYISYLCKKAPSSWPLFMVFICFCLKNNPNKEVVSSVKIFLFDFIKSYAKSGDSFSLIWTLYCLWRCNIDLTEQLKRLIRKEYEENWLVMAFLSKKTSAHKMKVDLVNRNRRNAKPLFEVVSVFGYGSKNK